MFHVDVCDLSSVEANSKSVKLKDEVSRVFVYLLVTGNTERLQDDRLLF